MRRLITVNQLAILCWKRSSILRGFARTISRSSKLMDLDRIRINEKAVIFPEELLTNTDFFYQEMLSLDNTKAVLDFFREKQTQFDGLGIKLLVEKLIELRGYNLSKGKKIRKLFYDKEARSDLEDVRELLDEHSEDKLAKLTPHKLEQLIKTASLCSIRSEGLTLLAYSKFMKEQFLSPSESVYSLLLNSLDVGSEAFKLVQVRLGEDLATKRVIITDFVTGVDLLECVLSSTRPLVNLVRMLEQCLLQTLKGSVTVWDALGIFGIYARHCFSSPNLILLDSLSSVLLRSLHRVKMQDILALLRHCSVVRYDNLNLLAGIDRQVFTHYSQRLLLAAPDGLPVDSSLQNQLPSDGQKTDEDSEAAILGRLRQSLLGATGRQGLGAIPPPSMEEAVEDERANGEEEALLAGKPGEMINMAEVLFHMAKLSVGRG